MTGLDGAIDEQPNGVCLGDLAKRAHLRGQGERRHPIGQLARHTQRLAARRQDHQGGARAHQGVDEQRTRLQQMLAIVQNEQHASVAQVLPQGFLRRLSGLLAKAQRGAHTACEQVGILERREPHPPSVVEAIERSNRAL